VLFRSLEEYVGPDWLARIDDPAAWDRVSEIPAHKLWFVHQVLKRQLMSTVLERTQRLWAESEVTAREIVAAGALLDPEVLTIGFVRRFTEYKRPALIFHDIERLKRIVRDPWQPVQIVFAGKSHPADTAAKNLLREIFTLALDRDFEGRIAFVEDYDMHMARVLARGVDVWLNTPRRRQEACGTSGMKASVNGVLHLSVRDGWWHEGYDGSNGWAIGDGPEGGDKEKEDEQDSGSLYDLLEKEIVPLYYERDRADIPQGWVKMVKQAMRSVPLSVSEFEFVPDDAAKSLSCLLSVPLSVWENIPHSIRMTLFPTKGKFETFIRTRNSFGDPKTAERFLVLDKIFHR